MLAYNNRAEVDYLCMDITGYFGEKTKQCEDNEFEYALKNVAKPPILGEITKNKHDNNNNNTICKMQRL